MHYLWNASAHLQKKVVHTCSHFFVDALVHYIKTHIICGMRQHIYKKVVHTQAFRTHFRLTWSPKPETGTRNPKPKTFKMCPLDLRSKKICVCDCSCCLWACIHRYSSPLLTVVTSSINHTYTPPGDLFMQHKKM